MKSLDYQSLIDDCRSSGLLDQNLPRDQRSRRVAALADRHHVTPATVYRWLKRIEAGQFSVRPRRDRGAVKALPQEVVAAAQALCAQPRNHHVPTTLLLQQLKHMYPQCEELNYSSLRRVRETVRQNLSAIARSYSRLEVSAPNVLWQIDSTISDLFVILPNQARPVRCDLTVCQDACSRAIMFARYAPRTPSMEIAGILHQSILPQSDKWPMGGVPQGLLVDWGKVYMSRHLELALADLGVERDCSHPYYPQDKGKVERVIGTIHHNFEPLLPGYCGCDNTGPMSVDVDRDFRPLGPTGWIDNRDKRPLLTLGQLNELLWQWITGTYHHSVHSTLGMSPLECWLQHAPVVRTFSDSYLEQAFLNRATRKVARGMVSWQGLQYRHELLSAMSGVTVELRYDPADMRQVYIYYEGRRLCAALVDAPLLWGSPQAAEELERRRRENRDAARQRRELLDSLLDNPAARADLTERLRDAEANAPVVAAAPATVLPDPVLPVGLGLTPEDEAELADYNIAGLPLIRRRRAAQ